MKGRIIRISQTGSFVAADAEGNRYRLLVFTRDIEGREDLEKKGGGERPSPLKFIKTDDGEDVNWLEKGKYRIARTGVELTSDNPDAI